VAGHFQSFFIALISGRYNFNENFSKSWLTETMMLVYNIFEFKKKGEKMDRKKWTESEIHRLKRSYKVLTIKELMRLFPERNANCINAQIRRLKDRGEIVGNKDPEVRKTAMRQRRWLRQVRPGKFNVNPDSWDED
jgi:hypothetical protein